MPAEDSETRNEDAEKAPEAQAGSAPPASDPASPASAPPTAEASPPSPDGAPKPARRKKKRKKSAASAPPEPLAPELDAEGRERPLFVRGFPKDPELDRLVQAFELGNYAFVRQHAPELAERSESPLVREAARELARRIEPDPLIKLLLLLSIVLLVALSVWAYKTHGS